MMSLLFSLVLAQATLAQAPQEIVVPQEVRALPGQLDPVRVFNSNSPELIGGEGILLSTFSPEGKQHPQAHLNLGLSGRFDIFAHHVYRAIAPDDLRSMYLGILLYNPSEQAIQVDVITAASYLSQPDAPFISLPTRLDNPDGAVYAGPGSRVMSDVLRHRRDAALPPVLEIPPQSYQLVLNLPIPVATLEPPLNGRSTLMQLRSDDTVYVASMAQFAPQTATGEERAPTLEEWRSLLITGDRVTPRDRVPTPLDAPGQLIYGRVAGVAQGARWQARLTDSPAVDYLTLPERGGAVSYGISTLVQGRLGTGQVQSGELLVRYPDTAYQAHGNYGVEYDLTLPLQNTSSELQRVAIALQTPIKEDTLSQNGLRFFATAQPQTFFRGTVRVRYTDDQGVRQTRYVHLVQQRGQAGDSLTVLNIAPGTRRLVEVTLLYPPDATPPQVLTIRTLPY